MIEKICDDLGIDSKDLIISNLVKENQKLKEDYNKIVHEATEFESRVYELKDRIDKATDYIEKCNPDVDLYSMFLNESYISNYGAWELLEILKGVKDDNNQN